MIPIKKPATKLLLPSENKKQWLCAFSISLQSAGSPPKLEPTQQDGEETGGGGGVSEQGCQLRFLCPSLMAALSKYYFPFEESDHIPPLP